MNKKFLIVLTLSGILLSSAVFFLSENSSIFGSFLPVAVAQNYDFPQVLLLGVLTLPFSILGKVVSFLSATGNAGNGVAFALIAFFSFIPIIPVLKTYKIKEKRLRNFILILLCPLIVFTFAAFSSDAFIAEILPVYSEDISTNVKAVFGAAVYSGIISVILTEYTVKIRKAEGTALLKLTKALAYTVSVILVIYFSLHEVSELFIKTNTAAGLADGYVSVLHFIKMLIQYILDIAVISGGVKFINCFTDNLTYKEFADTANLLSKRCMSALSVIIIFSFLVNFIQIVLSPVAFSDVLVKIDVPVFSICFVLLLLLISKLMTENKKLKEDNDLFI